jgi:acyl carrier protein
MTKDEISAFCVDKLAEILRIPRDSIQTQTNFSRLGLDSAMIVYLQMDLEDALNLDLSPDAFYDHPTIDALSGFLAGKHAARSSA